LSPTLDALTAQDAKSLSLLVDVATSPDLPGLLAAGATAEEVLSLAPSVAGAMIASEGDHHGKGEDGADLENANTPQVI
jgi:predicted RNase H-like HicB family nuclease